MLIDPESMTYSYTSNTLSVPSSPLGRGCPVLRTGEGPRLKIRRFNIQKKRLRSVLHERWSVSTTKSEIETIPLTTGLDCFVEDSSQRRKGNGRETKGKQKGDEGETEGIWKGMGSGMKNDFPKELSSCIQELSSLEEAQPSVEIITYCLSLNHYHLVLRSLAPLEAQERLLTTISFPL